MSITLQTQNLLSNVGTDLMYSTILTKADNVRLVFVLFSGFRGAGVGKSVLLARRVSRICHGVGGWGC